MATPRVRDRRQKSTFWIDDVIVDGYAPVMARFGFGSAALAVYMVLCRRANDGQAWPGKLSLAAQAATSKSTVDRAVLLLERLELIMVARCFDVATGRQTSNLYTLLTPEPEPPEVGRDWRSWPPPERERLLVDLAGGRRAIVRDARDGPAAGGVTEAGGGCHPDTLLRVTVTPSPFQAATPEGVSRRPLVKGSQTKGTQRREAVSTVERADRAKTLLAERDPRRPAAMPPRHWANAAGYFTARPVVGSDGGARLEPDGGRDTTLAWARLYDLLVAERSEGHVRESAGAAG